MDNKKIKKVLEYIDTLNHAQEIFPKKSYLRMIKPYSQYAKILHTLPKKDITLILKNKMDYEKNKYRLNKIAEKHLKKMNKVVINNYKVRKNTCKRHYANKKVREKENKILKNNSNKTLKKKHLILHRESIKKNCDKKVLNNYVKHGLDVKDPFTYPY